MVVALVVRDEQRNAEGTFPKMKYLLNFHHSDNLCQDLFAAQVVLFREVKRRLYHLIKFIAIYSTVILFAC